MYVPKKLKWDCLSDFKKFLERETSEKIVEFTGYKLVTETTEYGMVDSQLIIGPKREKVIEEPKPVFARPKPVLEPKKEKKTKKVEEPKKQSKEDILAMMKARGKKVMDNKNKGKR